MNVVVKIKSYANRRPSVFMTTLKIQTKLPTH